MTRKAQEAKAKKDALLEDLNSTNEGEQQRVGGDSTAKKTRDDYMKLICKRSPKSELCGNTKMYDMMAAIAGQYDVPMWLML